MRGGGVKNNNKTKGKRRDDTSHQKIPTNLTQLCKNMITQNKKQTAMIGCVSPGRACAEEHTWTVGKEVVKHRSNNADEILAG